jgi:hypothetical protein
MLSVIALSIAGICFPYSPSLINCCCSMLQASSGAAIALCLLLLAVYMQQHGKLTSSAAAADATNAEALLGWCTAAIRTQRARLTVGLTVAWRDAARAMLCGESFCCGCETAEESEGSIAINVCVQSICRTLCSRYCAS